MQEGRRVLVHCEHGVGRSALLACAVLVYGGMDANDALHLVQEKRWQAAPNHAQVVRLREFASAVAASPTAECSISRATPTSPLLSVKALATAFTSSGGW